jgi:outer membrane protein assembly factor BamB
LLYGAGNICCFNQDGKITVLKAGRTFEVRATNALDDGVMASPAIAGRALILWTEKNLYRIETDAPKQNSAGN